MRISRHDIARRLKAQRRPKINIPLLAEAFDTRYYLANNRDVAETGMNPLDHYLRFGWREGRKPNEWFDPQAYLTANQDVLKADIEPLLHYLEHGRREGRLPSPPTELALPRDEALAQALASEFDGAFYQWHNRDVIPAGMDPLQHFLAKGWREGRNPTAHFDTERYLRDNSDVADAGLNPFVHYLMAGRQEGRPSPRPESAAEKQVRLAVAGHVRGLNWSEQHSGPVVTEASIVSSLIRGTGSPLILSFSHDDYLANVGGVQQVVGHECEAAITAGRLDGLAGFGAKSGDRIVSGIEVYRQGRERVLLDVASQTATMMVARLSAVPGCQRCAYAGSLRYALGFYLLWQAASAAKTELWDKAALAAETKAA